MSDTTEKIVMHDPKIYEQIGNLQGRFDTFEKNMTDTLEKFERKLDNINTVPITVYESHLKEELAEREKLKTQIDANTKAIEDIQTANKLQENTLSSQVAKFFNNAIVKIIGGASIVAVLLIIWLSYQSQVTDLTQEVESIQQSTQNDGN